MASRLLDSRPWLPPSMEESVKTPFKSIALIAFVLFVALGTFDTAWAQNTISVSPTSLTFCVTSNNSPSPAPQNLTVTAVSAQKNYTASATNPTLIKLTNAVSNTANNTPVIVQIAPAGYSSGPGPFTGLVQIGTSDGTG